MTKIDFLNELQDLLQRDQPLSEEMLLSDLPEWDSMSMMAIAGFFDSNFSKTLRLSDFHAFITIKDLIISAGINI